MEKLSFEEALAELESAVKELENDKLTLEESVKKFERGIELSNHCNTLLSEAEKSITVLIENANGEVVEEPFSATNEEE
ncbi:MAG: exodeoxyribonuclease VII small subunit [Clostridia bacterium]|nr:exodeoxyribonuclease VII small subunit [Clostridia bacterium]